MKRILLILTFLSFVGLCFVACQQKQEKSRKVIIIEEQDPIIKKMEEMDSMVIYKGDTVNRVIPRQ